MTTISEMQTAALDRMLDSALWANEIGGDEADMCRQELYCAVIVLVEQMDPRLAQVLERVLPICRMQLSDIRDAIEASAGFFDAKAA